MSDWALRVTYCDHEKNRFLALGGAAWKTQAERDANLATIPAAPEETDFVLDVLDSQGIQDDRFLEPGTVEILLHKPVNDLIREAGEEEDRVTAAERAERRS